LLHTAGIASAIPKPPQKGLPATLYGMLEPVGFVPCNFESNIKEKETASEVVQCL
jgi:hypothetical protein